MEGRQIVALRDYELQLQSILTSPFLVIGNEKVELTSRVKKLKRAKSQN